MEIKKTLMKQEVRVRKYPIDNDALRDCLRKHKCMTNQQLADALNLPLTTVAHWFRKDKCFEAPSADVWFKVKDLLGITTKYFDKSIMTFETRDGVYEKAERVYFTNGLAPTVMAQTDGEKILSIENPNQGRVYAGE